MQEHTGIQKAATSSGNVLEGINPSDTIVSMYKNKFISLYCGQSKWAICPRSA